MLTELQLSDTELKNLTLIEIENMMQSNRRSLHEFTCMPYPDSYVTRAKEFRRAFSCTYR